MKAILDTHVFLWWVTKDNRLTRSANEFIENNNNALFLSAASSWEIVLKNQLGKLELAKPPAQFFHEHMAVNQIQSLPITLDHTLQMFALVLHHRDPFDRILVAQAQAENLLILTADPLIAKYPVQIIW
jgi:PIN domain nuclease of toxin-antitoxin system